MPRSQSTNQLLYVMSALSLSSLLQKTPGIDWLLPVDASE